MEIANLCLLDSSVWGTVSDWVMVVVTTLSAVFLILTFRSQKEVQIAQQSLTDIEKERYRIEYRPKFEIEPLKVDNARIGIGKSTLHFRLNLLENEAKEVSVIGGVGIATIERITISEKNNGLHMPIAIMHPKSEYNLYFEVSPLMAVFNFEGSYFHFSLNFKDSIGNVYKQAFNTSFKDDVKLYWQNAERVQLI